MNLLAYRFCKTVARCVFFCTMRIHRGTRLPEQRGGQLLALSHLGHLDPVCASVLDHRPIAWMARKEFFCNRPFAWGLKTLGAFGVNRQGVPVSSIREAIKRVRGGQLVGICPEGGRVLGRDSVLRGAKIRKGICSVAIRSGVPVVPCILLGTHDLHTVAPWLPFRRGTIWISYGPPILPPTGKSTRAKRAAMAEEIICAYVSLYRETLERFDLQDSAVP